MMSYLYNFMANKNNNPLSMIFISSLTLSLLVCPACSSHKHDHNQVIQVPPYIIDYGNGTIIRDSTFAPSFSPPPNNALVQSKDITIVSAPGYHLRARIIIPAQANPARKIPVLLYFHGGAFCIGSAFALDDTNYLARVSAEANVVTVSIEYRLYPEHPIPAPYDDALAALNWIAAQKTRRGKELDPWLIQYGDLDRVCIGGESAGANIAHNLVVRAQSKISTSPIHIRGLFLAMPYFLGSKRVPNEPANIVNSSNYKIWSYVCHSCKDGVDNKYINPFGPKAVNLGRLGCKKLLVYTAKNDDLRGRGQWYYQQVKASGWTGQAELVEALGQDHVFHIFKPHDSATTKLINDLSAFLNT